MQIRKAIEQLLHLLARASGESELVRRIAELSTDLSGVQSADLMLAVTADELVLVASTLAPDQVGIAKLPTGQGLCGQTFMAGEPLFIPENARSYPGYSSLEGIPDEPSNGVAVLPLHYAGKKLGVLYLRSQEPWHPTRLHQEELMVFAVGASAALTGYWNVFKAGRDTHALGALSEVSRIISSSPYLEEILQLLVNFTATQFGFAVCTVRLLDESSQELVLRATQAPSRGYQRKRAIKLGESIAGRAISKGSPVIVKDVQADDEYIGHDLAVEQGLRSMICVPLMIQERPVGVLSCYKNQLHEFSADEVHALETLAQQAAVSIEHAKLQVRATLMQEMHHRVKNNLQQIASLLRLQIRHSGYKTLEEALNDTLARILAISTVHDLLSREDLDHVSMKSIAEQLVQHQQVSFLLPGRFITFLVRGDDVFLETSQGTQVALILNELIQNAIEHGFKSTLEGEIHINIEDRRGEVGVWVSNNGDRLPPDFDLKKSGNLGTQIVNSLAQSLGGEFKLSDIWGWAVAELKFSRHGSE